MEPKDFFAAFPTLQLKEELKNELAGIKVTHITTTRNKDILRIYIAADRLIAKKTIIAVEKQIKEQLFEQTNIVIKIYERFTLSKQYTPQNLYREYRDSILLELRNYSPVLFSMLKKADAEFSEEHLLLTAEDIHVYHDRATELTDILNKIFTERCGVYVDIEIAFKPAEESATKKDDEIKLKRQIEEIEMRLTSSAQNDSLDDNSSMSETDEGAKTGQMTDVKEKQSEKTKVASAKNDEGRISNDRSAGQTKAQNGSFSKSEGRKYNKEVL